MVKLILVRHRPERRDPKGSCAILPGVRGKTAQPLPVSCDLVTTFWDEHDYVWPADTLHDESGEPRLVSVAALRLYRNHRPPPKADQS